MLGAQLRGAVGDGETGGDLFQIGEEREQGEVVIDQRLVRFAILANKNFRQGDGGVAHRVALGPL